MGRSKTLTIKQKKFVQAYVESGNATQAYRQAGYSAEKDNVAWVESSKLLRHPKVSEAVAAAERELALQAGLSAGLIRLVWKRSIVKGIETDTCDSPGVLRASELAAKHLGMFKIDEGGSNVLNVFNFYLPSAVPLDQAEQKHGVIDLVEID